MATTFHNDAHKYDKWKAEENIKMDVEEMKRWKTMILEELARQRAAAA